MYFSYYNKQQLISDIIRMLSRDINELYQQKEVLIFWYFCFSFYSFIDDEIR